MIHQELNLVPYMTLAENIWIGRERRNAVGLIDHAALRQRTQALFDRLGIGLNPDDDVRSLTIANQQLVEIAKAVSYDSRVLIMDEPPRQSPRRKWCCCSASSGSCATRARRSSTSATSSTRSSPSPTRSRCFVTATTSPPTSSRLSRRSG